MDSREAVELEAEPQTARIHRPKHSGVDDRVVVRQSGDRSSKVSGPTLPTSRTSSGRCSLSAMLFPPVSMGGAVQPTLAQGPP